MHEVRIPVLLLQWRSVRSIGRRLRPLGEALARMSPKLGLTLSKLDLEVEPWAYAAGSLVSSFIYGVMFFLLTLAILLIRDGQEAPEIIALMGGAFAWLSFYLLHLAYPSIALNKIAIKENRDLLFALREVMIDVNGGVPLFWALRNVGYAGYGYVSNDFRWATEQIEGGVPEREALKRLAIRTESEYLKRAMWQIINAMESGAPIGTAIGGIVDSVEGYTYRDIKQYTANLNFLMLIYMFAAAVVPSIGITFLVLLSAFGDFGVTIETVSLLVGFSFFTQLIMIGYMRYTRPDIFGG